MMDGMNRLQMFHALSIYYQTVHEAPEQLENVDHEIHDLSAFRNKQTGKLSFFFASAFAFLVRNRIMEGVPA